MDCSLFWSWVLLVAGGFTTLWEVYSTIKKKETISPSCDELGEARQSNQTYAAFQIAGQVLATNGFDLQL
jgi:hypothetical protein